MEDDQRLLYALGPRFFAEVGRRRLLLAFHTLSGREVDAKLLEQLNKVRRSRSQSYVDKLPRMSWSWLKTMTARTTTNQPKLSSTASTFRSEEVRDCPVIASPQIFFLAKITEDESHVISIFDLFLQSSHCLSPFSCYHT